MAGTGAGSTLEELIAEGRYLAAAAIEEARGQKAAAEALFEKGRDFARAARLAAERGDLPAQLGHLLHGQEVAAATALLERLLHADAPARLRAAALYEEHRLPAAAAALHQSLGALAQARRLYERGGAYLELARLDEQAGDLGRAEGRYEQALGQLEDGDPAAVTARLGLGRLLVRTSGGSPGQLEAAVRHLQAARRRASTGAATAELDEIELALAAALALLGYEGVAREVLIELDQRLARTGGRTALPDEPLLARVRRYLDGLRPADDLLLGRYELREPLGSGGTGRVYRAFDLRSQRAVAIKLLPTPSVEHAAYKRFVGELEVLRRTPHPHRIAILDFDRQSGVLVMPLFAQSFATLALPLPLGQLRRLLLEALSGLAAAHALGVLHRGLKPQNLLLTAAGAVQLTDFGAAYLHELLATQTESALAAFAYAAPELLAGKPATVSSDLYSLGVIAYLGATGQLPFPGPDFLTQHAEEPVPDPRKLRPELPAPWVALLFRLLEKDPKSRGALALAEVEELVRSLPVPTAAAPAPLDGRLADAAERMASEGPAVRAPVVPIGRTPFSELYWGADRGLGRSVVIERWNQAALDSPAWPQQVAWLRQLAAAAGPGLQRVLGLELVGESAPRAIYEAPPGSPDAGRSAVSEAERALLERVLARLAAVGIAHGAVERSIRTGAATEPHQALLLVQAAGPLHWTTAPTPDGDRQALFSVAARP